MRLDREEWRDFELDYRGFQNRTLRVSRVAVSHDTEARLHAAFRQRHLSRTLQIELLDAAIAVDSELAHRVEVRVRMESLDSEGATAYLVHRIRQAGGAPAILEADAVSALRRCEEELDRFEDLRLYHFPLCILPGRFRPRARRSLPRKDVRYPRRCRPCPARRACAG